MSKLDELIKELCPDGVEYKRLGELGKFYGGLTGKSKEDFNDGNAVFISYKNVYSNPALDISPVDRVKIYDGENQRTLQYGDIVFTGSSETPDECGFSSVVTNEPTENLYLNSFCFFFRFNELSVINPDFAKHLFRSANLRYQISRTANGVTRFNVSKDKMAKVIIPLPPLEIQEEIVKILDRFTNCIVELQTELQAELLARRQQYEYYCNHLLQYRHEKCVPLKELTCKISSGRNKERLQTGSYPVYGSTGIISSTNTAAYFEEKILVARVGANAGYVHIAAGEYDVSDNTLIIDLKDDVNLKYIYYQLTNMTLRKYAKGGGQPLITAGQIKELEIPYPTKEIQNVVVEILDSFNKIFNDISEGLTAEIEARQKQYEYYRDKLLTFKELS